jgi:uncharacterized protein (DUF924 family)
MTAPWQPLLDWWFGQAESPDEISADKGKLWFGKRDSQDLEAQTRFGVFVDQALAGELTEWTQRPEGWLALVLLLDQLPRMIFRDTPKAFSGDLRAQKLVAQGIAADFDRQLKPIQRVSFIWCSNTAKTSRCRMRPFPGL